MSIEGRVVAVDRALDKVVWYTRETGQKRPECDRWWGCENCNKGHPLPCRPWIVLQVVTNDGTGWRNWYVADLTSQVSLEAERALGLLWDTYPKEFEGDSPCSLVTYHG